VRLPGSFQHFLVLWALGGFATTIGFAVLSGLVLRDHGWWGYLGLVTAGVTTEAVVVRIDWTAPLA